MYVWSNKFTPAKENVTQQLVLMVETFRMSDQRETILPYLTIVQEHGCAKPYPMLRGNK